MKHIVELSQDFIIQSRFIANRKEKDVIDWVDKPGGKAHGKYRVESIIALVKECDEYGNSTGKLQQVWLDKDDLKKVLEKVDAIDTLNSVTDYTPDDLPF